MQHDRVKKKLYYELLTPREWDWCPILGQIFGFHVAALHDSILYDMQHDHVLKKLNYDLLIPSPELRGVCRQNIFYPVAAFVIHFNLICNMPMF